ncbi:MAG: preprotein translocase subunit YajC [Xanthomonadales bacterium]|nr:preprotein translocase subunit YajC [Xanthomonadales bacterium]
MDFFISDAIAQAGGTAQGPSGMANIIMLLVFVAIFYFLLIRPQMKRQKEHRSMVEALSKGDEVVTNGGVLGKIVDVGDAFLTVEIANNIQIKVQKHAVGAVMPKGTIKES